MVAPQIFKVATEFRFEIASAVGASRSLTEEVGRISGAADSALNSLSSLSLGMASSLGLGTGGALSFITKAIQASEKFRDAQLSFSTIVRANKDNLIGPIDTFNERLSFSSQIIKNIVGEARKFALDEGSLLNTSKLLTAQLAQKGLAGTNFENSIGISREFLKASPLLGIDSMQAEGQLMRLIEGNASMGDTLFRRLVGETDSFSPFKKSGSKGFNALDATKRVDILRRGLGQFANDTEALTARVNSLTGQFTVLSNQMTGLGSILKPIGDVVKEPLIKVLKEINTLIANEGKNIANNLAELIRPIIQNPKALLINLMQMRELGSDLEKTSRAFAFSGVMQLIGFGLSKLFKVAAFGSPIIGQIAIGFSVLADALTRVDDPILRIVGHFSKFAGIGLGVAGMFAMFGKLNWLLTGLGFAIRFIAAPLAIAVTAFQILSRAVAIARVGDAAALPGFLSKLSDVLVRMKDSALLIISPVLMLFDALAQLIAPLFSVRTGGELLINILNHIADFMSKLSTVVVGSLALINGAMESLLQLALNIQAVGFKDILLGNATSDQIFGGMGDAFDKGFNDFVLNAGSRANGGEGNAIVQNVTNIGSVSIKNEFKEQQEPDRIAFTLKDQLLKAANNPTQARGRSFSGGLLSPAGGL